VIVASIHSLSRGVGSKGNFSNSIRRYMHASFLSRNSILKIGEQTQSCEVRQWRLRAPPHFASR
jgi:hypothetical protein